MTTNARDEKWSEWKPHGGGPQPITNGTIIEPKLRDGTHDLTAIAEDYRWQWDDLDRDSDIIAYRYKIKKPENGIADPDEEECLQLAYERMGDESVKVSIDELQDNVNKPKHYQLRDGYEVYDLRQDLAAKAANGGATYDQYSDWDRAIEYIVRMWGKNRLEDAKKGRWYLDKLIGKLEDQG